MIRDRIIICVASSWDYDPTSKHHIMQTLSAGNHIVWVDYHGTRRPAISRADLKAGCRVLRRFARGIRRVSPSIVQVTPLVIPGVSSRPLRLLHQRMVIAQIRRAIRFVPDWQDRAIQIWTFAPDVPFLAGQFSEEGFVYYCVDEHSQFEGIDGTRIRSTERETIQRADVVVAASEPLLKAKRALRSDIALVRHGVQFDHFAKAWRSPPPPPGDIASIRRPILGFFGLIQFWVDRRLVLELARRRPQYSIVLIGDSESDVSELRRQPNVHLLGRRPFEQLPAYCAYFDAGLMPFVQSPLTEMVNPIKMYEYLAAGLPVVSTPLPEAERFVGPIEIAETTLGFARACDRALESDYAGRRRAISRVVQYESWHSKVEQLSALVMGKLHPTELAMTASVSDVLVSATPHRAQAIGVALQMSHAGLESARSQEGFEGTR